MDILTPQFIINTVNEVLNQDEEEKIPVRITDDAIGYIQYLLSPYIDAMQYADIPESLETWVEQNFTGNMHNIITWNVTKYKKNNETTVKDIKEGILYGLIATIFAETNEAIPLLTSWDIKSILEDEFMINIAPYFGVTTNDTNIRPALPVTVTIGQNSFVHEMTKELVLGILTFYRAMILQYPLSMFGSTFIDYDNIIDSKISTANETFGYTVNVRNIVYWFIDKDFMQGLLTGALWTGNNPHQYITNLIEIKFKTFKENGEELVGLPNIGDRLRETIERIALEY